MSSIISTVKRKLDDGTIQEVFPRTPQQAVFNSYTGETLDDTISGLADEISLVDMRAAYELDIDGNNLSLIRTLTEETVSTVTIPGGGGGGTGDVPREEFDDLEQRVDTLEENVADLTGRVETLEENAPSNPEFEAHIAAKNNPHEVTKLQVGLGNVDDTSDQSKVNEGPIHDALELKADKNDLDTKADKTELESKADKDDLDKKADKDDLTNITTTLDTKVDSVKIGETEYKTGTTVTLPVYTSSEVDSSFGTSLELNLDKTNYKMTLSLKDKNGNTLSNEEIDFPIESMIVDASYEDGTLSLYIVDKEEPLEVDISSIVSGLVPDTRTIAGIDLKDNITDTELVNALKNKIKDVLTIPTISASAEANEGDKIGSITINGNTTEFYAPIDKDTITTVTTTGSGNAVTSITATNGALTATKGTTFLTKETETKLSKGTTAAGIATTLTHGGKFKAVTKTDASGHTVTDTETEFTLPSETTLTLGTTIGSGDVVTNIEASGHTITMTKGTAAHPTISTSTDTTSTETATHGGTIAMVDSVTRDSNGHVTKINTKTVTLPSDAKVTQTNTTTAADYRLLLSNSANDTTETNGARKSTNFTANPSTGAFFAKGFNRTAITGQTLDLNTLTLSGGSPEIMKYICKTSGGSNNITNIPVTGQPFILDVELIRWASATDYITKQTFVSIGDKHKEYVRYCTSGTWEENWTKRLFTDTIYTHPSYTARTGVPTANATPGFGGTFNVSQPVSDATGHITAINSRTITIPSTTATTSANGLMSSTDKTKLNATNIAYGTCSTEATTAAKVITISGNTNWTLAAGSMITIKFSATNSAQNPTFNVNNTGAKSVWYNTSAITTGNLGYAGTANRPMNFIYDGTQYVFIGWSLDNNSTNTTGTTNKVDTKLFLAGATSQASAPTTYSNVNVYIGTDNCLYSNGKKVTTDGHTHNYAGSASAGGPANSVKTNLTVKLNGGSTEGTNLFTFNGSTAKTINITPSAIGAAASSHSHDAATTSANGFMSSADKAKLDNTNIAYATCSTDAATAEKVATIDGNSNWTLKKGSEIIVKYTNTNSASSCTLNVNNTGAKSLYYDRSTYTGNSSIVCGYANRYIRYVYDGTYWIWMGSSADSNTTYSNFVKSGSGAKAGLVPAPSTTAGTTKYLREDGTWQVPPTSSTSVVNNLTSTSTTAALSAAQGKALSDKIDGLRCHAYSLVINQAVASTTKTSITTYNSRSIKNYDMICIAAGQNAANIFDMKTIPVAQFRNGSCNYILSMSNTQTDLMSVSYIDDTTIGVALTSANATHNSVLNVWGYTLDNVSF